MLLQPLQPSSYTTTKIPEVTATVTKLRFVGALMLLFLSYFFLHSIQLHYAAYRCQQSLSCCITYQICLLSPVTLGKTPSVTSSEHLKNRCHIIVT